MPSIGNGSVPCTSLAVRSGASMYGIMRPDGERRVSDELRAARIDDSLEYRAHVVLVAPRLRLLLGLDCPSALILRPAAPRGRSFPAADCANRRDRRLSRSTPRSIRTGRIPRTSWPGTGSSSGRARRTAGPRVVCSASGPGCRLQPLASELRNSYAQLASAVMNMSSPNASEFEPGGRVAQTLGRPPAWCRLTRSRYP